MKIGQKYTKMIYVLSISKSRQVIDNKLMSNVSVFITVFLILLCYDRYNDLHVIYKYNVSVRSNIVWSISYCAIC